MTEFPGACVPWTIGASDNVVGGATFSVTRAESFTKIDLVVVDTVFRYDDIEYGPYKSKHVWFYVPNDTMSDHELRHVLRATARAANQIMAHIVRTKQSIQDDTETCALGALRRLRKVIRRVQPQINLVQSEQEILQRFTTGMYNGCDSPDTVSIPSALEFAMHDFVAYMYDVMTIASALKLRRVTSHVCTESKSCQTA